ncbi:cytochrome c oxidase subunit NDUFA4-like [Artemia franciscana]|uniref:cytochrome c oxidase subunit NDUFA4-like n=1 Tax=Artemia franciscana TaxID=6661 RepID=UPI0032DBF178
MQGLSLKGMAKHPSLIPLFVFVGGGCVGACFYLMRLASRNPDVSWQKKSNTEPWQEYSDKQYKFWMPTMKFTPSPAPKYTE